MRIHSPIAGVALFLAACTTTPTPKPAAEPPAEILSSTTATGPDGMVITDEMMGRRSGEMSLTRTAGGESYGWSQMAPVKVGGGFDSGAERTYKFLNTLRGPNGEDVHYDRVGTCCPFTSPNSPFEGGGALLEVYEVSYKGMAGKRRLYFDWYDEAEMMIPKGLTAAAH